MPKIIVDIPDYMYLKLPNMRYGCISSRVLLDYIKKGTVLPNDVEIYTKNVVIAMLTELQLEIEKLDTYDIERTHGLIEDSYVTKDVSGIIQQKIDKLKESKDAKDNS